MTITTIDKVRKVLARGIAKLINLKRLSEIIQYDYKNQYLNNFEPFSSGIAHFLPTDCHNGFCVTF